MSDHQQTMRLSMHCVIVFAGEQVGHMYVLYEYLRRIGHPPQPPWWWAELSPASAFRDANLLSLLYVPNVGRILETKKNGIAGGLS
jgi:hypothetical protein